MPDLPKPLQKDAGTAQPPRARPRLAVWKFASCDGCQLSLLDCEAQLLELASTLHIARFAEASSAIAPGPYDLSLVEGSVSSPGHAARLAEIRRQSTYLVTIGACATAGGIQALRNFGDSSDFVAAVYPTPQYIRTLATSTPVSAHVHVDFELRGCPIDRQQLLEVISALLIGRRPAISAHSVCLECKLRGHTCVMVADGIPCLGPVTHAGCGALCPAFRRGCYGCYGPTETPNTAALSRHWQALGASEQQLRRVYRTFNAAAPAFQRESAAHEP
jgi:coenzyme F420-reducing hydrogenase gamma subunit